MGKRERTRRRKGRKRSDENGRKTRPQQQRMGMGVDEWECKLFREVLTEPSRWRGTRRSLFFKHHCPGGLDPSFLVTRDWIKWTFTLLSSHHQNPLLLHHLSHLAAFHGYLDVLKWL